MRPLVSALTLCTVLAVFTPPTVAQATDPDARRESAGRKQSAAPARNSGELEFRKSLALSALEKEIGRAESYGKPSERVRVLTLAADVLWDFDEAKARKLLRDSYSETFTPEFKKSDATDAAAAVRLTERRKSSRSSFFGFDVLRVFCVAGISSSLLSGSYDTNFVRLAATRFWITSMC